MVCRVGNRGPVRRAVEYDRGVGRAGHRPELALDLVLQQVLGLVKLQQQVGGRAHYVAAWRSGEKASASPAKLDCILRGARLAAVERVVKDAQQAVAADQRLWAKRGRRFDQRAAAPAMQIEQVCLEMSR
jgi:hypothetical protein